MLAQAVDNIQSAQVRERVYTVRDANAHGRRQDRNLVPYPSWHSVVHAGASWHVRAPLNVHAVRARCLTKAARPRARRQASACQPTGVAARAAATPALASAKTPESAKAARARTPAAAGRATPLLATATAAIRAARRRATMTKRSRRHPPDIPPVRTRATDNGGSAVCAPDTVARSARAPMQKDSARGCWS